MPRKKNFMKLVQKNITRATKRAGGAKKSTSKRGTSAKFVKAKKR